MLSAINCGKKNLLFVLFNRIERISLKREATDLFLYTDACDQPQNMQNSTYEQAQKLYF